MLSRRKFLQGTALVAATPTLSVLPSLAATATANRLTQVPGYFRLILGDITVTALYDGANKLNPSILHGLDSKEVDALLEASALDPKNVPIGVNAFLMDTGRNHILVDTGGGGYWAKGGMLLQNLRAAGYEPEQVDTVLLTHLHFDHSLGLVAPDGRSVFPNAMVRVSEAEYSYWVRDELLNQIPEERKPYLVRLRSALEAYASPGKLKTFAQAESPAPGVEAVPLSGHTAGHCGFSVSSQGQSLLAWGDIIHNAATQFTRPEISINFDLDQNAAVAARTSLLSQLAKERTLVAGAHLPFPGLGYVRQRSQGFAFLPVEYAAMTLAMP